MSPHHGTRCDGNRLPIRGREMNNPIRQHSIPAFLLRHFTDDRGRLWEYDKCRGNLFHRKPTKTFVKKDAYTIYRYEHIGKNTNYENFIKSVVKDYRYEVENFARDVEGKAAPVVERIIQSARANQLPELTEEQADSWKRFMLTIARRTPESRKRATSITDEDAFYEGAKARADQENVDLPDRESFYRIPGILGLKEIILANVHAKFAAGESPRERLEEEKFCCQTGIAVAVIRDCSPRNSFLLGSHGLAIVNYGGTTGAVDGSWLPIAHDVAVLATGSPAKEFLLALGDTERHVVEAINTASVERSQGVVARWEETIRSFVVT